VLWSRGQLPGSLVLHDFDARQITKRRSEDLRKELQKWLTTAKYGNGSERGEAERKIKELTGRDTPKGVKRKASKGNEPDSFPAARRGNRVLSINRTENLSFYITFVALVCLMSDWPQTYVNKHPVARFGR